MKGIFVVLDGVADEPCSKLGDKTPLDYAKTPNLDFFASKSQIYSCFPIAEGIAPQSSSGIVSLLGYDFRDYSRGVLEAIGAGVNLNKGDLVLRCNFSTIDNLKNLNIIDRRAGRTLTTKEALELAEAINSKIKLPFRFEIVPTIGHRAVLVFRGDFSSNISNVDPSYESGLSVESLANTVKFSSPLDDSSRSAVSADLVNTFVKKSYLVLENHPVNLNRRKKGYFPANFILCRDAGSFIPESKPLSGKWMGFGYMPLEKGIIDVFGMNLSSFNVPTIDKDDFYDYAESVLNRAIFNAVEMIQKYSSSFDYFYIHFKETDLPGHDNKPLQKVKFIEMIDNGFFGKLRGISTNFKLVVTADHTTSCRKKMHTSNPVPAIFYDSLKSHDSSMRFTEKDSSISKSILGRQLLKKTLFS